MEALGSAEEVVSIADAEPHQPQGSGTMDQVIGNVSFKDVTFSYPDKKDWQEDEKHPLLGITLRPSCISVSKS
eukprot:4485406-Amphidinium_carterae.1